WTRAGGTSLEIVEIDYAEVLRDKLGDVAAVERLVDAALQAEVDLDESAMRLLLEIVGDPSRLGALMQHLEKRTANTPGEVRVTAFVRLVRALAEHVGRTDPAQLDHTLKSLGPAAARLSAEGMLELLFWRRKPDAMAGTVDVVTEMVNRMSDGV